MRRTMIVGAMLAGMGGALTACGDEDPLGVGSGLLGEGITTFEVVLDAEDFLLGDTTFDGLGTLNEAPFRLVAEDFAGELDAHTVFRIFRPYTVSYAPTENSGTVVDSLVSIGDARVIVVIDTLASSGTLAEVEVLPVLESWDFRTTTWDLRYDTAGVAAPWTEPGGTTGPVAGSGIWDGGDTLVIEIDSAAAAVWQDTVSARYGALLRTTRPGTRLRIQSIDFDFDVVPVGKPDTVVTAGGVSTTAHLVAPDVTPPPGTELRIGGLPAWRTLLNFQALDDVVVDICADPQPECQVRLGDATLTLGQLLLTPVPVAGRRIELPFRINAWRVLTTENVPVLRAPLAGPVSLELIPSDTLRPAMFMAGATDDVAVPITTYVRSLLAEPDPEQPPLDWLALLSTLERQTFGFAAFASMESSSPPRLRLVMTVPNQELFQ